MIKARQILVATDLSEHAGYAEARAAMLARQLGKATLTLLYVVPRQPLEVFARLIDRKGSESAPSLLGLAESLLGNRARALAEAHGIATRTVVRTGRPHLEIATEAEALDADLVVVGGYGADFVRELFLGATAQRVVDKSRRTVLVVKKPAGEAYRTLLVPVDFSPISLRALDWAEALAGAHPVSVAHIYEAPFESTLRYASVTDEVFESYQQGARAQAEEALQALIESRRAGGADFLPLLRHGHPAAGIRELATETTPDLIIMGRDGQSGFEDFLLGSVTRHVLSETAGDLLVVLGSQGAQGTPPS